MGDKVVLKYEDQQRFGIIVGFVTICNIVNAVIRLDNGCYIEKWINCIKYCE